MAEAPQSQREVTMATKTVIGGRISLRPMRGRVHWFVLAAGLALAAALILWETRGLIFYYDEWNFLLARRANDASAFFAPHNEHPALVPVVVWKLWWTLFGTTSYLPYRLLIVGVHLLTCGLLYAVARRRIGASLALVPALVLAFLGPAFEDLVWPFQIGFIGPFTCLLAIILALDGGRDRLAAVLAGVALFCSGNGVPVVVVVAVLLARTPRRALRVLAVPVAFYAVWFAAYGVRGSFHLSNLKTAPQLVGNSLAACLAALTGLPWTWGRPLAVLFMGLVVWRLLRPAGPRQPLLAALAGLAALWGLQAAFRGGTAAPPPSHYLYAGAVLLILVLIELGRPRLRTGAAVVVGLLTVTVVVVNAHTLHREAPRYQRASEFLAAELGALELAGPAVAPDFQPDNYLAPQITARPYFAAIARTGSVADAPTEIAARPEAVREAADVTLLRAAGVALRPASCARARPAPVEFALPRGGMTLRANGGSVTVALRRFGHGYANGEPARAALAHWLPAGARLPTPPVLTLAPGAAARLTPPGDGWTARVSSAVMRCS